MKITAARNRPAGRIPQHPLGAPAAPTRAWSGLGETFMGAAAVEAYLHEERGAASCSGTRPASQIEARNSEPHQLSRLARHRRGDARQLGRSTSRCGTCSARPIEHAGVHGAGRQEPRPRSASTTPVRATSTSATSASQTSRQLGASATKPGPTRTWRPSCTMPTSWPCRCCRAGHHGMKIWPFDIRPPSAPPRLVHLSRRRARCRARALRARSARRGRQAHGHHGRVPFSLWGLPMAQKIARALAALRHLSGTRTRCVWTAST